jgi:hypothetical protein
MVCVEGRNAPTVVHFTLKAAKDEAHRLSQKPQNKGAKIYVLAVVDVLEPTHIWQTDKNQP